MDKSLRRPISVNVAFSALSGFVITLVPGTVGNWLGVNIDGWLRLFGIMLIGHAILLAVGLSQVKTRDLAKVNLAMIAPYPLIMVGLVATGLISRNIGQVLALADGAIIAAIAFAHWAGLRSLTATPQIELNATKMRSGLNNTA